MKCCQIDCPVTAEYRIEWGQVANPDNYTEACEGHVGALLGHRPEEPAPDHYRVYPIGSSSVEPSAVCKRCNDLRFVVSTGQIGVPCPECNAEKARARCEWGCHVHWSGWPASHHPNCTVNGEPREPTAFQDFVASLPENGT